MLVFQASDQLEVSLVNGTEVSLGTKVIPWLVPISGMKIVREQRTAKPVTVPGVDGVAQQAKVTPRHLLDVANAELRRQQSRIFKWRSFARAHGGVTKPLAPAS